MDELPDLQSDADVDALMARLRRRLDPVPPRRPAVADTGRPAPIADGLGDLLAVQEAFASTIVRAMELMVVTLEDVALDHGSAAPRSRPARPRRASRKRTR
jgi:hypothetical protein